MNKGGLRLMLISYPRRRDPAFESAVLRLGRFIGPGFRIERCQTAFDAVQAVTTWRDRGRPITCLEFVGHGRHGAFSLGDEYLFTADGAGLDVARELGKRLAPRARVHLLGCRTARDGDGRWLEPFEKALGACRTLWGTRTWLTSMIFAEGPLSPAQRRALVRAGGASTPE